MISLLLSLLYYYYYYIIAIIDTIINIIITITITTINIILLLLLLGVQHFYIYNTATIKSTQDKLITILLPYIDDGIVTLIPWYYHNCVINMASGRALHYY